MAMSRQASTTSLLSGTKFATRSNEDAESKQVRAGKPRLNSGRPRATLGNISNRAAVVVDKTQARKDEVFAKPAAVRVTAKANLNKENVAKPKQEKVQEKIPEKPASPMDTTSPGAKSKLPAHITDIDKEDKENPQLVSEYVNDIYDYLRLLEDEWRIKPRYLEGQAINGRMRAILVDWLVQVHLRFHLLQETLYLTVAIIDRFLQEQEVGRSKLQLVGVTSMLIAAKYEEMYAPEINDFVYITDNAYTKKDICVMERLILKTLGFNLGRPLPLHFLRRNSKAGGVDPNEHTLAKYLMELTITDYDLVHANPSEVSAAALCLSVKLLDGGSGWGGQEDITQYYTAIREHIEGKAYYKMVHSSFFAIANNDATDDELDQLKRLIEDLAQEQPYWNEQIPLKWIDLRERLMQKKADEVIISVIDLDTGYEIAKQAGIESKEDFCNVFRFYHQLGDLVFFDEDNLRSLIVLNPQWLIDAFCKVITIRKAHEQQEFPDSRDHWRNLEEDGLLHDVVLDHVWDPSKKDHLLNLMQRFGLILPLRLCNQAQVYQEAKNPERLYIVPSFLPLLEDEKKGDENWASAVVITFDEGFVPTGVTSALISFLITEEEWALHGKIYHNHASFLPEGEEGLFSISIQEKPGILELQGKVLDRPTTELKVNLEPYLQIILQQLHAVLTTRYCKAKFELAVWCSCKGRKESTLKKIGSTGEAIKGVKDIKCHRHIDTFPAAPYSLWFNLGPSDQLANDDEEVSDKLLQKVASRIPKEWHELGNILGCQTEVDRLTTPIQGGPGLHGMKMLMKWYRAQRDISIPDIKRKLASVLRKHKRVDLAKFVEGHHELNADRLFSDISPLLINIWYPIGISLDLPLHDLDEIKIVQMAEQDPAVEMLRIWKNKTPKDKQRTELIEALREVKRNDVAEIVS